MIRIAPLHVARSDRTRNTAVDIYISRKTMIASGVVDATLPDGRPCSDAVKVC
jgi:hypothetical protein